MSSVLLTVTSMDGSKHCRLSVSRSSTVGSVKRVLESRLGVPLADQRLMFGTLELADTASLESQGIVRNSAILVLMPRSSEEIMMDPMSSEGQQAIEREIRQRQIQESFEVAMEHNPESFARVFMLFVPLEINGIPLKAFVDSGAQNTIISAKCAEKCRLDRLIDKRFAGVAKGIGTAQILGKIHMVQLKIGRQFFPCSLTVLEKSGVDLLFGLDMLKRHQAIIDLRENCLRIGDEDIQFLPEKDIPDMENLDESKEVQENTGKEVTAPINAHVGGTSQPNQEAGFPETEIMILVRLGFSRDQSIAALQASGGNTELAASLLLQQSGLL